LIQEVEVLAGFVLVIAVLVALDQELEVYGAQDQEEAV